MVVIKQSSVAEVTAMPGLQSLIEEYAEETGNPAIGKPEVQMSRYFDLYEKGLLRVITATEDGGLVGLVALVVSPSQHYGFPVVSVESIFLKKAYRKGSLGLKLLDTARSAAKDAGAPGMAIMAPPESPLDKLCRRLGFVNTHKTYWCHVE